MASKNDLTNKIGEHSEGHLLKVAKKLVAEKTQDSDVLDTAAEARIPKFDMKELYIGRVLGRGGFCVVSEVTNIKLRGDVKVKERKETSSSYRDLQLNDEHYIHNVVQDRNFMESHCIRKGKDCRYAIKRMQDSSKTDPQLYVNAVVDLAIESRFLSVVRHPNIIKMRAMDCHDPFHPGFFLVLDKLYEILPQRLLKWQKRQAQVNSFLYKCTLDRSGSKAKSFWIERLTIAYDLACALNYLHGLQIIYRDLKPDNIGFDVRGDVKIFDFGLAKELDPKKKMEDGLYNLTGDTGSLRYMAPEVALCKPYNRTVDVYSFSILLWEICALETPYKGYSLNMFDSKVIKGGARPKVRPEWGDDLCRFMRGAMVDNPSRPDMNEAVELLREQLNQLSDEDIADVLDASRKSQMSA